MNPNIVSFFSKALSSYEYHLRTLVDPSIERYVYDGVHCPTGKYKYYIIGTPAIFSILTKHLTIRLEMRDTIHLDNHLKNHTHFIGMFVYHEDSDRIHVSACRDFKTGDRAATVVSDEINDFVYKANLLYGNSPVQLPLGFSQKNFNDEQPSKPVKTSKCDCGAFVLGYKDSDDYAHSRWCSALNKG
jgi:hypothetical protein